MEIGIIGIGLMGKAFVERFLSQDYIVRVYNRTIENIKDLEATGVIICSSPVELISQSNTIILMLSNAEAISTLLKIDTDNPQSNQKNNKPNPLLKDKTIIQMATISPNQSKDIAIAITTNGGNYLESPVLGSIPEAQTGTLIIMSAGPKKLFDKALPVLEVLSQSPRYIGDTGSAAALKLAMNQLIASLTAGFSLSLGYALKNGVDKVLFMDTVRESALYAKTYDKKLQKYLDRDFGTANFSTQHLLKDIRLFIEDASTKGLNTDALQGIERITNETVESGMERMDYSSIYQTINPDKLIK